MIENHVPTQQMVGVVVEDGEKEVLNSQFTVPGADPNPGIRSRVIEENVIPGTEYTVKVDVPEKETQEGSYSIDCFGQTVPDTDRLTVVINGTDRDVTFVDESC